MTADSFTVVFSGGGTGGHLFPGLAAAEALVEMAPRASILFAGQGRPWERQHVARAGYDYHVVPCRPWPRRVWSAGSFLAVNARGFLSGRRVLRACGAAVVVGLGGYTSAPVARAALSLKMPLVLLEQNVVPGRVNRWLSRKVACVCTSFESSRLFFDRRCVVVPTGSPVRRELVANSQSIRREKLLLITGGSLGASALNAAAPEALATLKPALDGWRVVHQTGDRDLVATQARYHQLGLEAEVTAFADLASLLPRCGLVVARAGGSTLAELAVAGAPAIVCPYAAASDDHQRRNAAAFTGIHRVLEPSLPDLVRRLARELAELLTDGALRQKISQSLLRRARPDAAARVAEIVREFGCARRPAAGRRAEDGLPRPSRSFLSLARWIASTAHSIVK